MKITKEIEDKCLLMLAAGKTFAAISDELGISQGAIAKIKKAPVVKADGNPVDLTDQEISQAVRQKREEDDFNRAEGLIRAAINHTEMFSRAIHLYYRDPSEKNWIRVQDMRVGLIRDLEGLGHAF